MRWGCRTAVRTPVLTATIILMLALVVGGNTTVFSMVNGLVTKPAAGVTARDLVTAYWIAGDGFVEPATSYANYEDLSSRSSTIHAVGMVHERFTLLRNHDAHAVWGELVTPDYFRTLGISFEWGRAFTEEEAHPSATDLPAIVSARAWREYFGADPSDGAAISLNGVPATIVGVVASPYRGSSYGAPPVDVWVPLAAYRELRNESSDLADRSRAMVSVIGRLEPGVPMARARAEIGALWNGLKADHAEIPRDVTIAVVPYSANAGSNSLAVSRAGTFLALFSIVTLLTVVVVCGNVGNLLLGRALVRQRELALRQALGASMWRLGLAMVSESLVLVLAAWAAACGFAWWTSRSASAWLEPIAGRALDFTPDLTVVGYALVVALVTLVVFTLVPLWWVRRHDLLRTIRSGEHGIVAGRSRLMRVLVVVQLAFSVLLMVTSVLAYRSLRSAETADLGFGMERLLVVNVNTSGAAATADATAALLPRVQETLERRAGIEGASYASRAPGDNWPSRRVRVRLADAGVTSPTNYVGPGYFRIHGLAPIEGREFESTGGGADEVVITRALATALWPDGPAVGQALLVGAGQPVSSRVVGVVPDAWFSGSARNGPARFIFFPAVQDARPTGESRLYVRYAGSLDAAAAAVRQALQDVDERISVAGMDTMADRVAATTYPIRMLLELLGAFAAGSLLIALIGQYAVVRFSTERRMREFGLRLALGASPGRLTSFVMRDALRLTLLGLAAGCALSLGTGLLLASAFYGVTPLDPFTYASVSAGLLFASLLASYLPARRAGAADALATLRDE